MIAMSVTWNKYPFYRLVPVLLLAESYGKAERKIHTNMVPNINNFSWSIYPTISCVQCPYITRLVQQSGWLSHKSCGFQAKAGFSLTKPRSLAEVVRKLKFPNNSTDYDKTKIEQ
jgi:hypothetical protein